MKLQVLRLGLGLVLMAMTSTSRAADDFQVWLASWMTTDVTDTWSAQMYTESWFTNDAQTHRLYNLDAGVTHKTTDHLRLGINIRQQQVRVPGAWLNENRVHGHATFVWTWKGLSFADRNRVELRFREKKDDIVRYRKRIKMTLPAITETGSVKPYLFNEFFIDSDHGEYNQNRLAAGLTAKLSSTVSASSYYLLQSVDRGDWEQAHVLGFNLSAKF